MKNKIKNRIIAVIMTIVMLSPLILAAGCAKKPAGGGSKDTRVVMTIDGHDVTYDEFRYFYLNFKRDMEEENPDVWSDPDSEPRLLDSVIMTLTSNYAKIHIAEEHDIKLSKNEISGIDGEMEYTIKAYGGEEQYYQALDEYFMTGDLYRFTIELNMLETKLRPYITDELTGIIDSDDATVEADIRDNFIRVTHVLIQNPENASDEERQANMELAQEIKRRADAGEDFNALVAAYGEDPDLDIETGYYITRGEFLESFETAAFGLEIGEISDVVESINGFHIIKRLEQDPDYVRDNFSLLRDVYKARAFNDYRDVVADSLEIEYTDLFETLNIDNIV